MHFYSSQLLGTRYILYMYFLLVSGRSLNQIFLSNVFLFVCLFFFLQNYHLYGLLMDHKKCRYCLLKMSLNSEILHDWKGYIILFFTSFFRLID